jgi:hypothetical protein
MTPDQIPKEMIRDLNIGSFWPGWEIEANWGGVRVPFAV